MGYGKAHGDDWTQRRARPDLRGAGRSDPTAADRAHRPQASPRQRPVPRTLDLAAGGVEAPARPAPRGSRGGDAARSGDAVPPAAEIVRARGGPGVRRSRQPALGSGPRGIQGVRGAGGDGMTIKKSIHVKRPVDVAFRVFTQDIGKWWPLKDGYTFGGERADQIHLEARPGGRFFERFTDGEEFDVGAVTVYEPPSRVVFTWKAPGWDAPT